MSIAIVFGFKNGTDRMVHEDQFDCSSWTMLGHLHRMIEEKEKGGKVYTSGKMWVSLEDVELMRIA